MIPRTKRRVIVQTFFKGTVIFLYFISRYIAEPIFIAACCLPAAYCVAVCLVLRFGGAGRMLTAKEKARRFVKKGVVSGERRELFYKKCIKGLAPDARAAYSLFLEGKETSAFLSSRFTSSVKVRGEALKGGMLGVGLISALSVFTVFFCGASVSEAVLRTAICALIAALTGVGLRFVFYSLLTASEKAAERLARIVDGYVLREKREDTIPALPPSVKESKAEEGNYLDLRALLRDLDERERTRA